MEINYTFAASNQYMGTETEVASFLKDFKEKMKFWDVLFRDERGKNTQALVDLELRPIDRKTILEALETKDYSEGPLEETLYGGADMWVFGKSIKKKEVYIKITMGATASSVICISFHLAEHKMNYPLK
ncbi:MAG: hypothetical protein JJU34_13585 [Lunatimonas sp.]|uniref:hypothetical protein n=1 Tax=Lunatimonas sp. TaxID=2060141 RepID=UPI00263B1C55|nr:hypothetical protein [Lunatimonas sp.]MCC5938304.1 hypothetical protein [Lunatimonas sp.]